MNAKGFTLIELTAIIVIFAAIFLVTFPNLINVSKNNIEKEYKNMVDTLCLAGKSYIYSNLDKFSELSTVGSVISLDVNILVLNDYVDTETKNPKTGSEVNSSTLEFTVLDDNSLDCDYVDGR